MSVSNRFSSSKATRRLRSSGRRSAIAMIFERYPISSKNSSHFAISSSCGNSTSTSLPRPGGAAASERVIFLCGSLPLMRDRCVSLGRTISTGIRAGSIVLLAGREAALSASDAAVRIGEARAALGTRRRGRSICGDDRIFVIHGRLAHESPHPWVQQGRGDLSLGAGGVAESIPLGPKVLPRRRVATVMELPEELTALQRFHGHLGVYVTLGLRMGAIGKRRFGHYKGLRAVVESQPEPPMRCVLDGVQFSSGCTMGKGNIALESGPEPEVAFEKEGRRLQVGLRPGWRERIDREMSKDKEIEQSLFYYEISEPEVFEIREG